MSLKSVSKADPNFVPNYQLAGIPFVTSSISSEVNTTPIRVEFPYVTKSITVHNIGTDDLKFGFTENGVSGVETANYFILHSHNSNFSDIPVTLDVRCKELWFLKAGTSATGFSLYAALTPISSSDFPVLTGSLGFSGIG